MKTRLVKTILILMILSGLLMISLPFIPFASIFSKLNINNDIKDEANANFKNDIETIRYEIAIYKINRSAETNNKFDETSMNGDLKEYLKDSALIENYNKIFSVENGELLINDIASTKQKEYANSIGIRTKYTK